MYAGQIVQLSKAAALNTHYVIPILNCWPSIPIAYRLA